MNFTSLIGSTQDLGARFFLVGVLPAFSLALFIVSLVWSGAPGNAPDFQRAVDTAESLTAWESGLLFLVVLAAAVLSQPLQLSLVRVLEGYWGNSRAARMLAAPGKRFHRSRRRKLAKRTVVRGGAPGPNEQADAELAGSLLRRLYPPERGLLPTRLGNVLRAAEHRAGSRYGLEAVVVWSRLYPLLPERVAAIVDDERDQLDLTARFCAVFLVATGVALGLLATHGWWLLVPATTIVLAVMAYRGAVAAALAYGEGIEAAFDLHRFDLLRALHLPLPPDPNAEKEANAELSAFLDRGKPVNFAYDHCASSEPTTSELAAVPAASSAANETRDGEGGARGPARSDGLFTRLLSRLGGS